MKKHWFSAVALPLSGLALAGTVVTSDIATDLISELPSYPGYGGYIQQSIAENTTAPKIIMSEVEPYSKAYLDAFYSNVMNPQDLASAVIVSNNMHPMSTKFNDHIVAHFEANDYDIATGSWPENDNRTAPLQNNGFDIHVNEVPAQKTTVNGNTFLACNGDYDNITGNIPSFGAEEGGAIIFVTKAGTRQNNSGTNNNLAFSLDSSATGYNASNPAKFRLIENTSAVGSKYRGYIGYMNGDGNSSTTKITTDGLTGDKVEVHVMYTATGVDGISAYFVNGKPVHIDSRTKTNTVPLESDQLSICGSPDDFGVASDIKIAELLILKDNGATPLPYSLLTQAALSMASRYGVTTKFTSSFNYNTEHLDMTAEELGICGTTPFDGAVTCVTEGITQGSSGGNVMKIELASPVVSGGRSWSTYNNSNTTQLPLNRELSASVANRSYGYLHDLNFLGNPALILDSLSPYNTTTSKWKSQFFGSEAIATELAPTPTSEPLTTITNPIDGSTALHCNGTGALSGYVAGGVTPTDGMTILISGQLNNVDSGEVGPRGFFNIGEFGGTSASNRGLVELRHTLDGYLWESSLGGTTEKILVGDKPFIIAVQFNESALGNWIRDVTIVTENGMDKRLGLNTNMDRVANDDTVYICDDGRGQHGQADITSVAVFSKLNSYAFINDKQTIHKALEAANGNHPLAGDPLYEPNLKEHDDLIKFLKTLVP